MSNVKSGDAHSGRRRRGVVLGAHGFARLNTARRALEHERNEGARLSLEQLSSEVGLSSKTLAKVLGRGGPVDIRTLEAVFTTFGLGLRDSDYESTGALGVPGSVPSVRTPLIGRAIDISRIHELLPTHRIVTLTGSGGIGKTRLAIELASIVAATAAERVVFVDLSKLVEEAMVASAILGAFGLSQAHQQPIESLARAITSRALCVVDNCEHLLGAVADVVDRALTTTSFLSVLATSREPLGIAGERVVRIASLDLPPPETDSVDEAMRSAAVGMFVERVTAYNDSFLFQPRMVRAVVEIVRQLDGLPLAIELAAARSDVMALEELRKSLSERLDLLGDERPSLAMRHRSVRDLIDWSYRLLEPDEQRVFRSCGIFMGDFDIAAVTAVVRVAKAELIVGRLVRKSLLVRSDAPDSELLRVRMLEPVRHVALEALRAANEAAEIRAAHAAYYAALVRTETSRINGDDRTAALATLMHEESNVREALDWGLLVPQSWSVVAAMVGDLADYWETRAAFVEGERRLEQVAEKIGPHAPPDRDAARVFEGLARMRYRNGDVVRAVDAASQALAMNQALNDAEALIASKTTLAVVSDDLVFAKTLLATSVREAAERGLARHESLALVALGRLEAGAGSDPPETLSMLRRAVDAARRDAKLPVLVTALAAASDAALESGEYEQAITWGREGFAGARTLEATADAYSFALRVASASSRLGCLRDAQSEIGFLVDESVHCTPSPELFATLLALGSALIAQALYSSAARLLGSATNVAAALPYSAQRRQAIDWSPTK